MENFIAVLVAFILVFKTDADKFDSYNELPQLIMTSTSDFYAADGKPFALSCYLPVECDCEINFVLPNKQKAVANDYLSLSSVKRYLSTTRTLEIHKFNRLRDKGTYGCEVTKSETNEFRKSEHLVKFVENPHLNLSVVEPIVKVLLKNDWTATPVTLSVDYDADHQPEFSWYDADKNRLLLEFPANINESRSENEKIIGKLSPHKVDLHLKSVDYDSTGNYTLIALDRFGDQETISIRLEVYGVPIIKDSTDYWSAKDDQKTEVNCTINSLSSVQINWWFETCIRNIHIWPNCGNSTTVDHKLIGKLEPLTNYSQLLTVILQPKFHGFLQVQAINDYGSVLKPIAVKFGENIRYIKKLHKEIQNDFTKRDEVLLGDDVKLECSFPIYDAGNITWFVNDEELQLGLHKNVEKVDSTYTKSEILSIRNVSIDDEGKYKCKLTPSVRPSYGMIFLKRNLSTTLTVVHGQPAKVQNIVKKIDRKRLEIECKVLGYPQPNLTWFKDQTPIDADNIMNRVSWSEQKTFLTISYLIILVMTDDDVGNYSCVAVNQLGSDAKSEFVEGEIGESSPLIYVVIVATIFVIAVTMLCLKIRRDRKEIHDMKAIGLANFEEEGFGFINLNLDLNEQTDLLPYNRFFEFPREKLRLKERLGAGAFGVVVKAVAEGILAHEEETIVAVKTIYKQSDNEMMKILIAELKIMIHLGRHLNIVNLLGAVTKNIAKRELLIICEYCQYGNIRDFLQSHRSDFVDQIVDDKVNVTPLHESNSPNPSPYVKLPTPDYENVGNLNVICKGSKIAINTTTLISWSFQISRGMDYLASKKIIHGDLAARNVLLCEDNVVKICDFGLAKSLYKSYIYKRTNGTSLPFKWLALESIEDYSFSIHSDIWAYGILLWEIFSLGHTPYPGMKPEDNLFVKLRDGFRMERPKYATTKIHEVMLDCWLVDPKSRPAFSVLESSFGNMLHETVKNHYIDLNELYLKPIEYPQSKQKNDSENVAADAETIC